MSAFDHRPTPQPARSPETRLDSWKSIAAYLGRGVRTVQRWEREEGLPVHRLAHEKRGTVYADRPELDAWWESRRQTLTNAPAAEVAAAAAPAIERITWMGAATFWPALSSDGRLVAYISDGGRDGTTPQIWLQQIGGSATCLTTKACDRSHLSFSPDDTRLVFTASDGATQNVYSMPTLGGEPRVLARAARAGRISPDGKWLAYIGLDDPSGVRISALDGSAGRHIATELIDVSFVIWAPDSKHVVVQAHADPSIETDYWLLETDGRTAKPTGILQPLRQQGMVALAFPPAWAASSLVFSLITMRGVTLWRQRLDPTSMAALGEPERLTLGNEFDSFVTGTGSRVAFVNTHTDQNIWTVALDSTSGMARGLPRRLTRGPGFVAQLSASQDGRSLACFAARPGSAGILIRDLDAGTDTEFAPEPRLDYGFPALAPSGRRLAYGARSQGPRVTRPIWIAPLPEGAPRKLGDDCGSRPRQWINERMILVERFGRRLLSVGLIDSETGEQFDLLSSPDRAIANARASSDGRWIAFDAARPGGVAEVFIARLDGTNAISEAAWIAVERRASHPFWSIDGAFLYYLPVTPTVDLRNLVRGRRVDSTTGAWLGDAFTAFASAELVIPASVSAAAPVATPDQMIFVMGDFRGDIWMMDLDPGSKSA